MYKKECWTTIMDKEDFIINTIKGTKFKNRRIPWKTSKSIVKVGAFLLTDVTKKVVF